MLLTCQWQMSQAKERRRLFEDETGRNFGQHAGEASLSFESIAERRRRERFLEPQQYPAGDVYAAGGAERQRKVTGRVGWIGLEQYLRGFRIAQDCPERLM
jgi:hypothetical protein